jgi:hypothetical protein
MLESESKKSNFCIFLNRYNYTEFIIMGELF